MAGARKQLRVDGQAAVERVPRRSHQAHGKLALEHENGGAEHGAVAQQFEGERGGDLVRRVGHAQVKVGELHLDDVALQDLQKKGVRRPTNHECWF